MLKKIQAGGTPLSLNEMKEVKGGASAHHRKIWYCQIEPGYSDYVCYSVQPKVPCGYASDCADTGNTCHTSVDLCIH